MPAKLTLARVVEEWIALLRRAREARPAGEQAEPGPEQRLG
jgi:hypothetical protein